MTKWTRLGIVTLWVGLVAFGALAAQGRFVGRDRTCMCDGMTECLMNGDGQSIQQMQQLRLQQMVADGTGPHGMSGGRQMRRGL